MLRRKRGQLWISAVIYIALGVVVLTIVLSAGIPLITKMKDRNVYAQTKKTVTLLDENIRAVTSAPAAQRFLTLEMGQGNFSIDDVNNAIRWQMTTKAELQALGTEFKEGNLNTKLSSTIVKGEYSLLVELNYTGVADLTISPDSAVGPYSGKFTLAMKNNGISAAPVGDPSYNKPIIQLKVGLP